MEATVMAKDPSMPFYVNDWLSSPVVARLSLAQQGGYFRLLCYCWASGNASLPDDEDALAALSGAGEGWLANGTKGGWAMVRACFVPHPDIPGALTNVRIHELWTERKLWREKSAEGGQKSAQIRRKTIADKEIAQNSEVKGGAKGGSTTVDTKPATKGQPKGNSSSSSSSSCIKTLLEPIGSEEGGGEEPEEKPKTATKEKGQRQPNPLFDAIAEVTGTDATIKTNGIMIGKATAELSSATPPYSPAEVRQFGKDFLRICTYAKDQGRTHPTIPELIKNIGAVRLRSPTNRTTAAYDRPSPPPPPLPPEFRS